MADSWFEKAKSFLKLGRTNVALHCCERALELNPRDCEVLLLQGGIMENMGDHKEALKCYEKATEANPRSGQAWYNKGAAYGNFGDYHKALGCFQEAERQKYPGAATAVKECQEAIAKAYVPKIHGMPVKSKLKAK